MSRIHMILVPALLLTLCLALSGCWSDDLNEKNHLDDLNGLAGAEGLSAQESQEADKPSVRQFALPIRAEETLDPFFSGDGIQQMLFPLLYEGLFELDESFTPQKLLCSDYSSSDGYTVWTFTLKDGVTFSNGSPLTAEDVAASYQRARSTGRYSSRFSSVTSIRPAGADQVVIELKEGNNRFPALLDVPILSKSTLGSMTPAGTGPYFYSGDDGVQLLRENPRWHRAESLPLSTIPLRTVDDSTTLSHLFSSHEIQMVITDYIGASPTGYKGATKVREAPTTIMQYLGFNCRAGLFADPLARSAVSKGLYRDSIVKAYFSGHAISASFPVSPASAWYPKDLESPYSAEAFRAAMEKAGLTAGHPHTVKMLVCDGNSFRLSAAKAIAAALSVHDLKIQLQILPYEAYLSALQNGQFDLYYGEVRMTPDFNSAPLLKTGGSLNYGGFSDPMVDALLASAFTTSGTPLGTNKDLMTAVRDLSPIAVLSFKSNSVVLQAGVADEITPTCANPFYQFSKWKIHIKGETTNG